MRLTISGTPDLSPDCTVADTGEPAGLDSNGNEYFTWEAGGHAWYLWFLSIEQGWVISQLLQAFPVRPPGPWWSGTSQLGEYAPQGTSVGTVTVAEYIPPPVEDEYLVVKWKASGEFTILKKRQ
jgi:hypothetical protein